MGRYKPGVDRRRCDRISVDYPLSYTPKCSGEISAGIAVNLSEGGLLGCLFDRISVGTILDLEMFYTFGLQFTSLNVEGRIIWKDIWETAEAIEYQYGIEFLRMDGMEKAKLFELLASL